MKSPKKRVEGATVVLLLTPCGDRLFPWDSTHQPAQLGSAARKLLPGRRRFLLDGHMQHAAWNRDGLAVGWADQAKASWQAKIIN